MSKIEELLEKMNTYDLENRDPLAVCALRQWAGTALALLAKSCEWKWHEGNEWWGTGCGKYKRGFTGGSTIEENGYKFCPFCRGQIKEIR